MIRSTYDGIRGSGISGDQDFVRCVTSSRQCPASVERVQVNDVVAALRHRLRSFNSGISVKLLWAIITKLGILVVDRPLPKFQLL